ncbi:MAG: NADH-quinone oxidoreductase subunit M [Chloroflexi bacterium]|nr:NADH-quinone oxidoreductase subunit M [Chloroflexota bacterium]
MTFEEFLRQSILTLITFVPFLGGGILMLLPEKNNTHKNIIRWAALLFSLIPLGLSILLWIWFVQSPEPCNSIVANPCFEVDWRWFPAINARYHLGVDGISLPLILLTAILTPLAILMSWDIDDRVKVYMGLFLTLEMGMMGVFVSLDLLLWFVFYEFGLVPMYLLINQWGSEPPPDAEERRAQGEIVRDRRYASVKFMIYTIAASVGMLLSIAFIGGVAGTFSIPDLTTLWPALEGGTGVLAEVGVPVVKTVTFILMTVAFAVKVPLWPFHTWLPDAHTEAPTAGSMILAGVLLKLGAYGFIRIILPLFPEQAHVFAPVLAVLAMLAIVLGAYASFAQTDFKRLVAYSSVNHMGFVMLAIAAAAWVGYGSAFAEGANRTSAIIAMNGAVLQMVNHGISAAAMFACVGMLYHRTHTRDLTKYGGVWAIAPAYGFVMGFTAMASLGLPGLNGFVSEFMVVRGVFPIGAGETAIFTLMVIISMLGLLFTGAYVLKALRNVLQGPVNPEAVELAHGHPLEMNIREGIAMAPLLVLMLVLGVYPFWLVEIINSTITVMWS